MNRIVYAIYEIYALSFVKTNLFTYLHPIKEQSELILSRKAEYLATDDANDITLIRLEMSFVEKMRHIYSLSRRIAKAVLPPVLAQRD